MILRILFLFSIALISACSSNPMAISSQQELQGPTAEEAQVVFLRSSFVGSAINASLYEVNGDKVKFIGVLANGTKIPYKTTAGKHVFMVVSEAADFMEADLKPGKNYFSIATPRMGAWKARFSLWPIKSDKGAKFNTSSSEFNSWVEKTKLVENTEKSLAWYESNKNSVKEKYKKYWPVWLEKSKQDIQKRTLSPQDGM